MKLSKAMQHFAAAMSIFAAAGSAFAAATYCPTTGTNADGLSLSDVTYGVNGPIPGPSSSATGCYGVVSGNINQASDLNSQNLTFGNNYALADGTDTTSQTVNLFGGTFTFTLTGPATNQATGTYTLTATDNNGATAPNFPLNLDLVVALKASDRYALYFFNDVAFDGSSGGNWSITYHNNGGQIPNLSHMDIFVAPGDGGQKLPEPGTLGLAGLALLGAVSSTRRQRNK